MLLLLLLLLLLLYTFLFYDLKASNLKKNQRQRKIRSPDPAILGRVQTRDPDPGHFGPDFDSGSDHRSAFTDPGSGCLPESTDLLNSTDFFYGLSGLFLDLIGTLEDMLGWRFDGGNCV